MADPDWHLTESTLAGLQYAEWLVIRDGDPSNFVDQYQQDEERAWAAAEYQGWIETIPPNTGRPRRLGDPWPKATPKVTGAGYRMVEDVRTRRTNTRARSAACRQALLLWLYSDGKGAAGTDSFPYDDYLFYGRRFTEEEIKEAVDYLMERGFVKGHRTFGPIVVRPMLDVLGTDCVEQHGGDVQATLNPQIGTTTVTYNQNFHGPVSGQVAQGESISQTQHQGIDPAALESIFAAMREALSEVADQDDRDDLEYAIGELRAAVEGADTAEVEKRVGRLRRLAGRVGSTALSTATTAGTNELLHLLGQQLGN